MSIGTRMIRLICLSFLYFYVSHFLILPDSAAAAVGLSRQDEDDDDDDEIPKPDSNGHVSLGDFTSYDHSLAGKVVLMDEKTAKITGLIYDGEGPATWFMVGRTELETIPEFLDLKGTVIPDENESCSPLQAYDGDDIILKLPDDMKFSDYNYMSMYCIRFTQNFGHVKIPESIQLRNGTSTIGECDQAEAQDSIL